MKVEVTALVCYGNSEVSKAISLFTKSKITHTAFKIVWDGKVFIADSQNDGFKLRKYSVWVKKYGYKYDEYEIPLVYTNVLENIYERMDETPYDYRLFVVRFPKHIISKIFGNKKQIESVKNEDEKQICSESFAYCLKWFEPHKYLPVNVNERIILEAWKKKN